MAETDPIYYAQAEIVRADIAAATAVLESGMLTNGPALQKFEDQFCQFVGAENAVGVSSGTAALHLAVAALGVEPGTTVIVPSLTFAASANAALHNGAQLEFVDIDPDTLVLDIDSVEEKLRHNPDKYSGVIAVDFAGYPFDSKRLFEICKEHEKWLLDDAAHALGAVGRYTDEEVQVGSCRYADITTFSFHPTKHISTGEGGMLTTQSSELAEVLRSARNHNISRTGERALAEGWYYSIGELGFNFRMAEIPAALGSSQLARIQANLDRRYDIATQYEIAFKDTPVVLPNYDLDHDHAYHLFVARFAERHKVYDSLRKRGIFTQVHYVPLHQQPLYAEFVGPEGPSLAHTEKYYEEALSLPMHHSLTQEQQERVIDAVLETVAQ